MFVTFSPAIFTPLIALAKSRWVNVEGRRLPRAFWGIGRGAGFRNTSAKVRTRRRELRAAARVAATALSSVGKEIAESLSTAALVVSSMTRSPSQLRDIGVDQI